MSLHHICIPMCVSYNTAKSALLDTHTMPESIQCMRTSTDISGKAQVPVLIITNMLHFHYTPNSV